MFDLFTSQSSIISKCQITLIDKRFNVEKIILTYAADVIFNYLWIINVWSVMRRVFREHILHSYAMQEEILLWSNKLFECIQSGKKNKSE